MTDQPIDTETERLAQYLLDKAHMFSTWEAPQTSKRAEALKECARRLIGGNSITQVSEFDRLMK